MIRNTHRVGDHLAVDDESGLTFYASDMTRDWDGQWRHKDNLDGRHPQLDVGKAVRRDPIALKDIRPRTYGEICEFTEPTIGQTTIFRPITPATNFAGIGDMVICASADSSGVCGPFIVYPVSHGT